MRVCECEACVKGNYNPLDYMVKEEDFKRLAIQRPYGLTGHLRVKNEAGTVEQAIESVLPALDELIIVYQESQDETEEILQRVAKKYPEKIRLFFYAPHVYPVGTDICHDSSSIHNLANYYNYGYVKTRYKYYMKIDADQIYFTEKLLNIKENLLPRTSNIFQWAKLRWQTSARRGIVDMLSSIFRFDKAYKVYKQGFSLSLGGVNTVLDRFELAFPFYISPPPPMSKDRRDEFQKIGFHSFNGCAGDHIIWEPHGDKRYLWTTKYQCEQIDPHVPTFLVGLAWCHFHSLKKRCTYDTMENTCYERFSSLVTMPKEEVVQRSIIINGQDDIYDVIARYWEEDRKYLASPSLAKYCSAVIEYFTSR